MGKSTYFSNALLKLFFNRTAIANLADDAASGPLTALYISLHTADPGVGGTQQSSEASYGGYARQSLARSGGGFVVTGNQVAFGSQVTFPDVTDATTQTITHFGVGVAASGATVLLYSGPVTPNIPVSSGFTAPALKTGTIVTEL